MIHCCVIPVSPIPKIPKSRDLGTSKIDEDGDAINADDVALGDHIVGTEKVLYDQHGPGALEVDPMKVPNDLTPAQWAKHCVTHLPYHPGCSICRSCKRPNTRHLRSHEHERQIPLLVGDYGTLRAEYRLDMANHPVFQVMGGAAGDQAQNKTHHNLPNVV